MPTKKKSSAASGKRAASATNRVVVVVPHRGGTKQKGSGLGDFLGGFNSTLGYLLNGPTKRHEVVIKMSPSS